LRCQLYLITPPDLAAGGRDPGGFADTLKAALDGGAVASVQLRLKDVPDDVIRRATAALQPIAQGRDVAFIMNDRPDLAAELGCDGVHVGQDDAAYVDARAIVGEDAIVGVTCHTSRHLAMEAAEAGADYVAFGAFFESTTKARKHAADAEILVWWQQVMTNPCVAIGGITVENCPGLVRAGADFVAVAGGVWNHAGGPAQAVAAFNAVFDKEQTAD
jgi:thiamine-phosphate pyrophosphorylase